MAKTKIFAHRGASGWDTKYAPENTMPAFEKAIEMGADGIELDVQLTKDGEIVICHDEKIDRTSNGTGWLKDYTLAELQELSFSKPHPEYGDIKIPTLREFMEFMAPTGKELNIELKTGVIFYEGLEEKTAAMVKEFGMEERVIYSSFNHYSLRVLKQAVSNARIGLLMGENFVDVPGYTTMMEAEAVHPYYNHIDKEYIDVCHANGIKVNIWTVDPLVDLKRFCEYGVDIIITDCPDNGRKIADGEMVVK